MATQQPITPQQLREFYIKILLTFKTVFIVSFFMTPVAYASTDPSTSTMSTEAKWGIALAFAGVTTVGTLILGVRLVFGDSIRGLLGGSATELIQQAGDTGKGVVSAAESSGIRLLEKASEIADDKVETVLAAVDSKILAATNAVNPLTHVNAAGSRTWRFMRCFLDKLEKSFTNGEHINRDLPEDQLAVARAVQECFKRDPNNPQVVIDQLSDSQYEWVYLYVSNSISPTGSSSGGTSSSSGGTGFTSVEVPSTSTAGPPRLASPLEVFPEYTFFTVLLDFVLAASIAAAFILFVCYCFKQLKQTPSPSSNTTSADIA